jgi:hypothetical protein
MNTASERRSTAGEPGSRGTLAIADAIPTQCKRLANGTARAARVARYRVTDAQS